MGVFQVNVGIVLNKGIEVIVMDIVEYCKKNLVLFKILK